MQRIWGFIILALLHFSVAGQEAKTVYFHLDKISIKLKAAQDSTKKIMNREAALTEFSLYGYLGVYPTDTVVKKNTTHYYFEAENHFKKVFLTEIGHKKERISTQKNLIRTVNEINNRLVNLENNGYPFAQIKLLSQTEKNNGLYLNYKVDSGDFFIVDKIHIKSKNDFHEKTVLSIMGIKPGDPYNEEKIRNLPNVFKNTGIYNTPRAPEILFRQGKAELYVYIEKKRASSADGYIGFQQDKVTQKLVLNGFINLELKNALNRSETIHLNWKNNPDKTQNLKAIFEYPYLFGSPIGIGLNSDLQKQDTSFVRSDLLFELIYHNPVFRVSLFDQIENSNTISSVPLNGFRDFSKNTIGLAVSYSPFLPQKLGFYHPKISLSGGVFNYRSDTLDDNTQKIANNKYMIRYEHTLDFLRFFHLSNSLQYQGLSSTVGLARNEYIYFGGLQTVRGFYELSLFGRENWILRNEIAFQPVELMAIKLLYDYANFRNETKNYTHSVGIGFNLINNNSQLEIIVANGVLNKNPLALSETKIHIGFKAHF